MKTIEITVSPDGSTTVETRGYVGPACQEATAFIETAIGTRTSEQRTAEFYQSAEQATTHQRSNA